MEKERINCRLTEREAGDYIKLHKIMELFKNMTALLLYHRPGSRVSEDLRFPEKSKRFQYPEQINTVTDTFRL